MCLFKLRYTSTDICYRQKIKYSHGADGPNTHKKLNECGINYVLIKEVSVARSSIEVTVLYWLVYKSEAWVIFAKRGHLVTYETPKTGPEVTKRVRFYFGRDEL